MTAGEMGMACRWRSEKGKRTNDNRDHGGAGYRPSAALFIVVDGSSAAERSGELAAHLVRDVLDWYVSAADIPAAHDLVLALRQIHGRLFSAYPYASASYLIAQFMEEGPSFALFAGDCLLGRQTDGEPLSWLNHPHTLADLQGDSDLSELAASAARHRLTRSFRAAEFIAPTCFEIEQVDGSALVMATDGYWAELSVDEQARFLDGAEIPMPEDGDDRSALYIQPRKALIAVKAAALEGCEDNFYVRVRP